MYLLSQMNRSNQRKTTLCVCACVCEMVDGCVLALTCRAASCKRLFWSSAALRQAPPLALMTNSPFQKEMHLSRYHPPNYRLRIIFTPQNVEAEHEHIQWVLALLDCWKCERGQRFFFYLLCFQSLFFSDWVGWNKGLSGCFYRQSLAWARGPFLGI